MFPTADVSATVDQFVAIVFNVSMVGQCWVDCLTVFDLSIFPDSWPTSIVADLLAGFPVRCLFDFMLIVSSW